VVLLGIYDHVALTPYLDERKHHQQMMTGYASEMAETQAKITTMIEQMKNDPNVLLRERIAKREQYIEALMTEIGASTENLIAPKKMAQVLGYLLSRQSGMDVKSVRNFPAEPVSFQIREDVEPEVLMYRHRLNLELEGTYFQVAGYLKMIEGMQERLYWDDMSFAIADYPRGLLTLDVHTLSMSKELIGVYE
jgi:MSHA biogenesis protein MshJ